ncbi:MAG: SRPBCC family protein [Chthoniobacterales bacterium]|nr:SRPBCC family protein [Chthoniobacterales bacterium]MCX7713165.1 SRPBCC family protein [Chthoniobacterales bacterium]
MNYNCLKLAASAILLLLLIQQPATCQTINSTLNPDQILRIQNGETLVEVNEIPGKQWPELKVTCFVRAHPQQVFELFTDWESAPSYIPNMLSAKIIAEPSPQIKDVEYTVRLPILGKISYAVRNYLIKNGESYQVRWELLASPLASSANGSLSLEPFAGQTLLRYQNLVEPKLPFVSQLKYLARDEALATVQALGREAERRYFCQTQPPPNQNLEQKSISFAESLARKSNQNAQISIQQTLTQNSSSASTK